MNDKIGLLSFPEDSKNSRRPYSNKLAALMETEVSRLVADAYFKTEKLIKDNLNKLELVIFLYMNDNCYNIIMLQFQIAEELLRKESLNYDEMVKLIGPPPNGEKRAVESYGFNTPSDSKTFDSSKK